MEKFSLMSALLGGFIATAFSYGAWIIQQYVLKNDEKKRVAFFYLVKICEILALKKAIDVVLKDETLDLKKKIGNDKYAIHMFCTAFSKFLNDGAKLASDDNKLIFTNMGAILKQLNDRKEDSFGYKIDNETVSKFPKSAILKYYFFINYIRQIQGSLEIIIASFERFDFKLLTPDFIYGQMECIKNTYESAESLIVSLAQESGINDNEVTNIINKQYQEFSTKALKAKFDKQITDIFLESFNKANSAPEKQEKIN
jgi:hypothetical protein